LAGCATTAAPAGATYSFGLWGDMPYKKAGDDPKLPAVLASINRADIEFSLYDGDIKDGSSQCTDDIYTDALSMFGSMKKPVVYIPGDNEWTDCHRSNNGGYEGLERLAHVRKVIPHAQQPGPNHHADGTPRQGLGRQVHRERALCARWRGVRGPERAGQQQQRGHERQRVHQQERPHSCPM
jgi:hypothetical protein